MSPALKLVSFFVALVIVGGLSAALGSALHPQLPGGRAPATSTHVPGAH